MVADKLIKISDKAKQELDDLKKHPRETYDDVISRLIASKHRHNKSGVNRVK